MSIENGFSGRYIYISLKHGSMYIAETQNLLFRKSLCYKLLLRFHYLVVRNRIST